MRWLDAARMFMVCALVGLTLVGSTEPRIYREAFGSVLFIDAEITDKNVAIWKKKLRPGMVVELTSGGGDIWDALRMGSALDMARATAVVPVGEVCASACTFLFAAGSERILLGELYYHAPRNGEGEPLLKRELWRFDHDLRDYYGYVGSPADIQLQWIHEDDRIVGPEEARRHGLLSDGSSVTPREPAPETIELPAGSFLMGSPEGEQMRDDNEGPQHEVTVPAFAIGKYEVTFDEWDICVSEGGCAPSSHEIWEGRRPVINVSWEDAQAFVAWLSELTGDAYRLPSEAEWEYATRAGATTRYSWGDDEPVPKSVNYRRVSAPGAVGSYPANPWGLHNMHGNVWEWVEDCWHDSYDAAPNDSGAWTSDDCDRRVLRGGASRYYSPGVIRSADRGSGEPRVGANGIGLRVAMIISSSGAEANPRGD